MVQNLFIITFKIFKEHHNNIITQYWCLFKISYE